MKAKNFIEFNEINEGFVYEDDINTDNEPAAKVPAEGAPTDDGEGTASTDVEGTDGSESGESQEGTPAIVKVYGDSEEDMQELKDAGIDFGEDEKLPEDSLFIKIKTVEGAEAILQFKEENEEDRVPVEGEEDTYDTELTAEHNEHEYRVSAEIKVTPGGEEKIDVQPDTELEEEPADSDSGAGDDVGTSPDGEDENEPGTDDENPAPSAAPNESRSIMTFEQWSLNESKKAEAKKMVKCAECKGKVEESKALEKDGKKFCSKECKIKHFKANKEKK